MPALRLADIDTAPPADYSRAIARFRSVSASSSFTCCLIDLSICLKMNYSRWQFFRALGRLLSQPFPYLES